MLLPLYPWGASGPSLSAPFALGSPLFAVPDVTTPSASLADRIVRLLPSRWFSTPAPVRDAIIGGISDLLAWAWWLIGYAKAQTRLATASGIFIDIFAFDYLGLTITRRTGEVDPFYSARVGKELLRERVTRAGMAQAILDLTGSAPVIIEPWLGLDCGGWTTGVGSGAFPPSRGAGEPARPPPAPIRPGVRRSCLTRSS